MKAVLRGPETISLRGEFFPTGDPDHSSCASGEDFSNLADFFSIQWTGKPADSFSLSRTLNVRVLYFLGGKLCQTP